MHLRALLASHAAGDHFPSLAATHVVELCHLPATSSTPCGSFVGAPVGLRILTSRRLDLAAEHTRMINRLRAQMLEYFPALEHAFDYKTSKAALVLLTQYQATATLWRLGGVPSA
ncbi:hypothetical protein ACJ6WF_41500 [Streptomyces sp. MMS24-I2-30]|uniref:hypothetical protein n=1 Tax=Streptomyces sp. MMS24-I2-30 TaxID=3351564 RepID=UPI003896C7AB